MKLCELMGWLPQDEKGQRTTLLVDSDTYVGIEQEFEGMNVDSCSELHPREYWVPVHEDSIRQGVEFIFNRPLKGRDIPKALREFERFLKFAKSKYSRTPIISNRCSLHAHIDVRDTHLTDIIRFIQVYAMYEKVIFSYLDLSRYKNNYCIPLCSSSFNEVLSKLETLVEGGTHDLNHKITNLLVDNCSKYGALNILSILNFGSLEFRLHPGTFNRSSILEWINILLSMKKWAISNKDAWNTLSLSSVNNEMFTEEIFGKRAICLTSSHTFEEDLNYGKSWVLQYLNRVELCNKTEDNIISELEWPSASLISDKLKSNLAGGPNVW